MNNRLPWAFPHFETRTNFAVEAKKIEPVLFFFFYILSLGDVAISKVFTSL